MSLNTLAIGPESAALPSCSARLLNVDPDSFLVTPQGPYFSESHSFLNLGSERSLVSPEVAPGDIQRARATRKAEQWGPLGFLTADIRVRGDHIVTVYYIPP